MLDTIIEQFLKHNSLRPPYTTYINELNDFIAHYKITNRCDLYRYINTTLRNIYFSREGYMIIYEKFIHNYKQKFIKIYCCFDVNDEPKYDDNPNNKLTYKSENINYIQLIILLLQKSLKKYYCEAYPYFDYFFDCDTQLITNKIPGLIKYCDNNSIGKIIYDNYIIIPKFIGHFSYQISELLHSDLVWYNDGTIPDVSNDEIIIEI
jgi:hypothetical protein